MPRASSHMARRAPTSSDRRFKKAHGGGDFGSPQLWQHVTRHLEYAENNAPRARVLETSVIDALHAKGILDDGQKEAAQKLLADFQAAALAQPVTGSYNPNGVKRDFFFERERSDAEEAAYTRWRHAVREVDAKSRSLLISVTCYDAIPLASEYERLKQALSTLVRWYGVG